MTDRIYRNLGGERNRGYIRKSTHHGSHLYSKCAFRYVRQCILISMISVYAECKGFEMVFVGIISDTGPGRGKK